MTTTTTGTTDALMTVLGTNHHGSPATKVLSFMEIPKPQPESLSSTQVIIQVAYAELNPVDHHKLSGNKPYGTEVPNPPLVVGYGGSGTVVSIHDDIADNKTKQLLGKQVAFIADPHSSNLGSFAQYIVCDRRVVTEIPSGISLQHAATIPIAGCTALESLCKVGLPIPNPDQNGNPQNASRGNNQRLLIVGGAGGVGSWITLLAKANYPQLEIVSTASSIESMAWCKEMGATKTIHHEDILSLGDGPKGSVDYIICLTEPNKTTFNALSEVLRPYGKICLVVAGDAIKSLDLGFVFFKCGTVATQTVFSSIRDGYRLNQSKEMKSILDLVKDGRVNVPLNPMSNDDSKNTWKDAFAEGGLIDTVASGHSIGKLVMRITS